MVVILDFLKRFLSMNHSEILIGLVIFLIIINLYTPVKKHYLSSEPITNWFEVTQFQVESNIPAGTDPVLIYDREIKKDFTAKWIVEVQRIDEKTGKASVACDGNNVNRYQTKESLPEFIPVAPKGKKMLSQQKSPVAEVSPKIGVKLSWFLGNRTCILEPGIYRVYVQWIIDRGLDYYPVEYEKISNAFKVISTNEESATVAKE